MTARGPGSVKGDIILAIAMSEPGTGSLPTWEDLVRAITGSDPADLAVTHLPDGVSAIDGLREPVAPDWLG